MTFTESGTAAIESATLDDGTTALALSLSATGCVESCVREGERELFRSHATDARKHVGGALVLTDQRIVLLTSGYKKPGVLAAFFGILGFAVSAMTAHEQVTTQIGRTELAGVEVTSVFRDRHA